MTAWSTRARLVSAQRLTPVRLCVRFHCSWSGKRPGSLGDLDNKKLAVAALLKPPICYDQVRVCCFCAQFLQDQNSYRVRSGPRPQYPCSLLAVVFAEVRSTWVSFCLHTQPPFEWRQEEIRQQQAKEAEEKANLWWDPLRVIELERKKELEEAELRLAEASRLASAGVLPPAGAMAPGPAPPEALAKTAKPPAAPPTTPAK